MSAENQTQILATYISEYCPHEILGGGAGDVAVRVLEKYRCALDAIMHELGVPWAECPAPVSNAFEIARAALGATENGGGVRKKTTMTTLP